MAFQNFSNYSATQQRLQQQPPQTAGLNGESWEDYSKYMLQRAGVNPNQMTPAMKAQLTQMESHFRHGNRDKLLSAEQNFTTTMNPMMQQVRANQPWARAGQGALQQQRALLGLKGADAMNAAYMENPAHQFAQGQMEQALMRNAAATGGLRGSDVQRELAEYTSGLTNQNIQNQLGQLGLMSEQGRMARGNIGQARAGQWIDSMGIQARQAEQRAAARASRGTGFQRALGAVGSIAQVGAMIPSGAAGFQAGANFLSGIGGGGQTQSPYGANGMSGY